MCCMGDDEKEEPRFKNHREEILHQFSIEGFIEVLEEKLKSDKELLIHQTELVNRIEKLIQKLSA